MLDEEGKRVIEESVLAYEPLAAVRVFPLESFQAVAGQVASAWHAYGLSLCRRGPHGLSEDQR